MTRHYGDLCDLPLGLRHSCLVSSPPDPLRDGHLRPPQVPTKSSSVPILSHQLNGIGLRPRGAPAHGVQPERVVA